MNLAQRPIPGYWYSNRDGQLMAVRAIMYYEGARALIVIENILGGRTHYKPEEWEGLELILHSPLAKTG